VDGSILAEGQDGDWDNVDDSNAGGGAGGSIRVQAHTIAGTGAISAEGGRSMDPWGNPGPGGAGGGGRIALYYEALTDSLDISAAGGEGAKTPGDETWGIPGAAGTIFLRPSVSDPGVLGTIVIDNAERITTRITPVRTNLTVCGGLEVINSATARLVSDLDVEGVFLIESGGRIER
jgi:hypothetical protein